MTARASSVASLRLPAIRHPLSSLGDPETISLRGYSADLRPDKGCLIPARHRPLSPGEESLDSAFRSQTTRSSRSFRSDRGPKPERSSFILPPNIPEGKEVIHGQDPDTPRLPDFGQKVAPVSQRSGFCGNTTTHSSPQAKLRIQVDKLEYELGQKIQTSGALTLRTLFENNHPEGKALASRDVLLLILTKFLGRFITVKQLKQLLRRLHLTERALITFEDLFGALREPALRGPPAWLDPAQRPGTAVPLRASQALTLLRGPARSRFLRSVEALSSKETQGPGWVCAPELKHILDQLKLHLEDREFEKLWKRLDADAVGAVKLSVLLKKLGLTVKNKANVAQNNHQVTNPDKTEKTKTPVRALSNAEEERRASIAMEIWLKDRFRAGARQMWVEFERLDPDGSGKVGPEEFLQVLRGFDLCLKREHLGMFLARCGLELRKNGVDYPAFLRRFQDRSQGGITYKILSDPQHRFHKAENVSQASSVTAVETKLLQLFQSEYLSLLRTFQSIDKHNKRTVTQEEFRAAVESRFGLEMSDSEFEQLLDRLPLDSHGNVQYTIFMETFDTRKGLPSLFHARPTEKREPGEDGGSEEGETNQDVSEEKGELGYVRGVSQLFSVIKGLVRQQYPALEKFFEELDEKNTRRLTQETMYQLLRRFGLRPEVSRGDIRRLWPTLITNQDGTLDFLQFARHFGHSPKSCCFPNAKRSPPKRGDEDLMPHSKKLNCVSDILVDCLRAKVELSVEALRREFADMDPYSTGFVSPEEFKDVLTSLCVQLNTYECDLLAKKFDVNYDGRVSYVEFLQPFATQKLPWKHGSNVADVLHSHRETTVSPREADSGILGPLSARLKKKLQKKRRVLRRACRRLDRSGSGQLSVTELKAALQLSGICLNPEELHHLLSLLDPKLSGYVSYRNLLPESHRAPSLYSARDPPNPRFKPCKIPGLNSKTPKPPQLQI